MLRTLKDLGVRFAHEPLGTFYCWGSLESLPEPFDDAMSFFWKALDHKVMTVPGQFFDVNPGRLPKSAFSLREVDALFFRPTHGQYGDGARTPDEDAGFLTLSSTSQNRGFCSRLE